VKEKFKEIGKKFLGDSIKVVRQYIPRSDIELAVQQYKEEAPQARKTLLDVLLLLKNYCATQGKDDEDDEPPPPPQPIKKEAPSQQQSQPPSRPSSNTAPPPVASKQQGNLKKLIREETSHFETSNVSKPSQKKVDFKDIANKMQDEKKGVSIKDRKAGLLKTYKDCFSASEAIDWLVFNCRLKTRDEALTIAQGLMAEGYIESPESKKTFVDSMNHFYKFPKWK